MAVAPQDVIRIDVIGDFNTTDLLVNSYQFKHTSGTSMSDADFLTDWIALMRAIYDAMKSLWSALVIWRRIRAQNLTTGLLIGEADFSTTVVGTAVSEQGAIQSAGLVVLKTNVPRVVMRKYIPVAEGGIDGASRLTAATQTTLNTFGSALLTTQVGLSGHTYKYGYLSPKTNTFVEPTTRATSVVVATQRRRRPGVGS